MNGCHDYRYVPWQHFFFLALELLHLSFTPTVISRDIIGWWAVGSNPAKALCLGEDSVNVNQHVGSNASNQFLLFQY